MSSFPGKVFISCSHKDSSWLKRLQVQLRPLERMGLDLWDETRIKPGISWREELDLALSNARIAVLLVSADFLASDFIHDNVLPPLLAKADKAGCFILPVVLKPCLFRQTPVLSRFQAINDPDEPLSGMTNTKQEEAFVSLVMRIATLLQDPSLIASPPKTHIPVRRGSVVGVTAERRRPRWWVQFQLLTTRFRSRYNQSVVQDHNILNVFGLGLTPAVALKLDQVFVELRIDRSIRPDSSDNSLISVKELAGSHPIWDFLRLSQNQARGVALVILGPPGYGKTILLQHVALVLANGRHRKYKIRAQVPVLLCLRELGVALSVEFPPTLGDVLQDHFVASHPHLRAPEGWFTMQLRRGGCMVLLDGLDEVPTLAHRKTVSRWIDQQVANYADCCFIITSRPDGYRETAIRRADVLEVQSFQWEQVQRFIHNWHLAYEMNRRDSGIDSATCEKVAHEKARALLIALGAQPTLNALASNPLVLTMIALVNQYHRALPSSRVELYAQICDAMLGGWAGAKGLPDFLSAAKKRRILEPLAAHLMEKQRGEFRATEFASLIESLLPQGRERDHGPEGFLRSVQKDSGLLRADSDQYSFIHHSFQEYLTAAHWLAKGVRDHDWEALVSDSWWHETLRLYTAKGGDPGPLLHACIGSGTLPALTLAAECLKEARASEDILNTTLTSVDAEQRQRAAEVKLAWRVRSLKRIDGRREIDLHYLTCAEYQLFVDDKRGRDQYCQPDHWADTEYPLGWAIKPVTGVSVKQARAFCAWLTGRYADNAVYRLPRPREVSEAPVSRRSEWPISTWCVNEDGSFLLSALSLTIEQNLRQEIAALATKEMPIDLAGDLVLSSVIDLVSEFVNAARLREALVAALDIDGEMASALISDLTMNVNLAFTQPGGRERITATTQSLASAIAEDLALMREPIPGREQALAKQIERDLINAICNGELEQIQQQVQSMKFYRDQRRTRRVPLFLAMVRLVTSKEVSVTRRAWRDYAAQMAVSAHLGFAELTAAGAEFHIERQRKVAARFFWALRIIAAREAGILPAWESIRIVREQRQ